MWWQLSMVWVTRPCCACALVFVPFDSTHIGTRKPRGFWRQLAPQRATDIAKTGARGRAEFETNWKQNPDNFF